MVVLVALIIYIAIPSDGSFIFRTKHIMALAIIVAFGWNLRSNIIIIIPALIIYLLFSSGIEFTYITCYIQCSVYCLLVRV